VGWRVRVHPPKTAYFPRNGENAMSFQPVPDGIEVVFKAIQNGVPIVNVYNVKDSTPHTPLLLNGYLALFETWWHANLQPILSNSYVLQEIVATSLVLATGPQASVSLTTGNQGALTGTQEAGNAALVVSWRTDSIGRSFRGRTYVGGLDSASIATAQQVTSSFATAISGAFAALVTAVQGFGGALAVLSRFALGVARVAGLLTEITNLIVDLKIDSQRRRTAN